MDADELSSGQAGAAGAEDVAGASPGRGGDRRFSRRGFLGATGAAGSAAVVTAVLAGSSAAADTAGRAGNAADGPGQTALARQRTMILQIARAGSVFPLPLAAYRDGSAAARRLAPAARLAAHRQLLGGGLVLSANRPPTMAGVRAAETRMRAGRLAQARAGADALIRAGLLGTGQAALLAGIGRRAAAAGGQELLTAVTLAIAAVFPGFDPASDRPAQQWLDIVGVMYQQGTLQRALQERGIR